MRHGFSVFRDAEKSGPRASQPVPHVEQKTILDWRHESPLAPAHAHRHEPNQGGAGALADCRRGGRAGLLALIKKRRECCRWRAFGDITADLPIYGGLEHHRSQILSRQSLIVCASLCAANGLVRKLTPSSREKSLSAVSAL